MKTLDQEHRRLKIEHQLLQRRYEELLQEHQQLTHEVNHDSLTRLHNRRYLDTYMEEACKTASIFRYKLSFLVIDIDHFKQYNDTYGHQAGDHLLQKVGKCLLSVIQTSDKCIARYGGEEFVAVLPSYDRDAALAIAQTIQEVFRALDVTVSIGISSYGEDGKTWSKLLNCADRRLYSAKQNGRNRIVAFE